MVTGSGVKPEPATAPGTPARPGGLRQGSAVRSLCVKAAPESRGRPPPAPLRPAPPRSAPLRPGSPGAERVGAAPMEGGGGEAGEAAALREALRLLRIEPAAAGSSAAEAGGAAPCSRNVLRKRRRWERVLAARRRRRRQERERSRARRDGGRGAARRHSKALAEQRLLEARVSGPRLCVDLGMADRMSLKETSRLASQIRRLYGANRQAEKPFWLYLTEFVVGSLIYEECFRMNDGFSDYLMDTTQESYLDLFPLDAIVYLTPDSENGDPDSGKLTAEQIRITPHQPCARIEVMKRSKALLIELHPWQSVLLVYVCSPLFTLPAGSGRHFCLRSLGFLHSLRVKGDWSQLSHSLKILIPKKCTSLEAWWMKVFTRS
uniref:tRNA (guanine(9)-N(1))-methyltransferase n=1 Tax=Cairina moschata TaxID=8855 RepID=A0A8C3C8J9_CAIMO